MKGEVAIAPLVGIEEPRGKGRWPTARQTAQVDLRKVLRFRQARLLKRDAKKWMPVFRKNPAFSKTLAEILQMEASLKLRLPALAAICNARGLVGDAMLARYIRDGELFTDNAAGALL